MSAGPQRGTRGRRRFPPNKNRGFLNCPPKWMVQKNGKPSHKKWMILGGKKTHYFRKHPNIFVAFVGSFECFDVGLTISFLQLDFLFMSVPSLFPQLRCQEARGGPESGSNVTVPLECQSLPLRRGEFWVLA